MRPLVTMSRPSKWDVLWAIREAQEDAAATEEALRGEGLLPVVRRQFELFAARRRSRIARLESELPDEVLRCRRCSGTGWQNDDASMCRCGQGDSFFDPS